MKTNIFGVLCCATFIATSAAYFPRPIANAHHEDSKIIPNDSETIGYDQAKQERQAKSKEKAWSLAAVGTDNCTHCETLKKHTITPLLNNGYRVWYFDDKEWGGPAPEGFPSLFYMDDSGRIIRTELGYKTPKHVKRYLGK